MANKLTYRIENEKVLVLEREFNAPQKLVFEMFKKAEHVRHFWGPRGWEVTHCTIDFRPNGVWHYCMKCVDKNQGQYFGMESWGKAVYKSMSEPKSIDYTDYFSDKDANENKEMPSTLVSMEFVSMGSSTKLVSRGTYATAEGLKKVIDMGMIQGITETWDRLEERLKQVM